MANGLRKCSIDIPINIDSPYCLQELAKSKGSFAI